MIDYDRAGFILPRPLKTTSTNRTVRPGAADRTAFPAQSSVLDEVALRERILPLYDLPAVSSCRFLTRGDSDVYLVQAGEGGTFYLKVYRPPFPPARAESEARLVADLTERGFPGVAAVKKRDGSYVTVISANEGERPAVLWTQAPPERPEVCPAVAEAIGAQAAKLHAAADELGGVYDLPLVNSDWPGDFLAHALPFMSASEVELMTAAAEWVQAEVSTWEKRPGDFGICHGDLCIVNIRRDPRGGIAFFDFGEARYTWRLADFRPFYPKSRGATGGQAAWEAFCRGYAGVRKLPEKFDERMSAFGVMHLLFCIGKGAATCALRMGVESPREWLPREIESLRSHCEMIPALKARLQQTR